jgi:hypothetical protein
VAGSLTTTLRSRLPGKTRQRIKETQTMIKALGAVLMSAALLVFLSGSSLAQTAKPEHPLTPEHPKADPAKPEHPKGYPAKPEHPKADPAKPEHPKAVPGRRAPEQIYQSEHRNRSIRSNNLLLTGASGSQARLSMPLAQYSTSGGGLSCISGWRRARGARGQGSIFPTRVRPDANRRYPERYREAHRGAGRPGWRIF